MLLKEIYHYFVIKRSGLFDVAYYLLTYSDVQLADINPIWHYIKFGWKEKRNPSPFFDTKFYLAQNFDVVHTGVNPLVHYILFGGREGRNPNPNFSSKKYTEYHKEVKAKGLIPLHHFINYYIKNKKTIPEDLLTTGETTLYIGEPDYDDLRQPWRSKALINFMSNLVNVPNENNVISHMIFLPFFSTGGAEMVALNYAKAIISETNDNVLLITENKSKDVKFTFNSRIKKFSVDDFIESDEINTRKLFIYDIIMTLRPKVVHNINSDLLWQVIIEKGGFLKKITNLFSCIFALQFDTKGAKTGYAEFYLEKAIIHLTGLLTDNKRFINDAVSEYKLHLYKDKFFCIYNPSRVLNDDALIIANNRLSSYEMNVKNSQKMFCVWAGRLDKGKRVDLLLEVIKKCQFADFSIFGQPVVDEGEKLPVLENYNFYGPYKTTEEIFSNTSYDAFLFTSRWEGMPNTLIEAGSWGVPIIAPNIGGISELINDETGFLLSEKPDYKEYRKALLFIKNHPAEAKRRAENLLNLISDRHTWVNFIKDVKNIPGYLS